MTTFQHFKAYFLCGLLGFLICSGVPVLGPIAFGIFFFLIVTPIWAVYLVVTEQPDGFTEKEKQPDNQQEHK